MKRFLLTWTACALASQGFLVSAALGVTSVYFTPQAANGGWAYTPSGAGTGTFSWNQPIAIVNSTTGSDPIVGQVVVLPDLAVSGSGGLYNLTPQGGGIIQFVDGGVQLQGTLLAGVLTAGVGETTGAAYKVFQVDIVNITSPAGNSIGSQAVTDLVSAGIADFDLAFTGANVPLGLVDMIDNGKSGSDGFSGSMTGIPNIPAPGVILLSSMGIGLIAWLRRRGAL